PFIVTLTFLACKDGEFWKNKDIGKTYDFFKPGVTRFDNTDNDIQKVQNFCVCEPYEYTFKIPIYTAHDGSQELRKDPGMPFCLPGKPTSDGILSFGCDKQKGGFSLNIAWIVTVTVDPSALQEKIDNTLLANATTNKDEPINLEDALFFGIEQSKTVFLPGLFLIVEYSIALFGYNTDMDNLQNLRLTSGAALQQLINTIKANNPVPSQLNESVLTPTPTEIII
ncbi:19704_t:CDS:2, partial [Dentiscutata erythropus]